MKICLIMFVHCALTIQISKIVVVHRKKIFLTVQARSFFPGHPYHLVSASPWPYHQSCNLFILVSSIVLFAHLFTFSEVTLFSGIFLVIATMSFWFRDIISEGTFMGNHTLAVQKGLQMGITLFVVSEAMFFLSVFWAYFHSSISPTPELGSEWPPVGIEVVDPFEIPMVNTVLLLSSGLSITYSHHCMIGGNRKGAIIGGGATIILAVLFTFCQGIEYSTASFTLSDGVFGSCFYFGTGFHGIHVLIGSAFLIVGLSRLVMYHLTENHHVGMEGAIVYWHFVDVVWLILYISVYWWGS